MASARVASILALVLWAAPDPAHAISLYTNITETDSYTNEPFHRRNEPYTVVHPNPIHGFATSQGVSALAGDGSGLAVHAQADLVPGSSFTKSTAIAAIEFEIVDPSTAFTAPVDVSFVGKYVTGAFGRVQAHLWRGVANFRGSSGNTPQLIFFAGGTADPDVGIWTVERTLMTRQLYSLELFAEAGAFDGFNTSSLAFIDPVISVDGGPGVELQIQFPPESTLVNPEFIDVPEPSLAILAAGLLLAGLRGSRPRN